MVPCWCSQGKKAKKGKKGSSVAEEEEGEEGGRKRFKACPSFFRFFTPLAAPGGARAKVNIGSGV